MLERLKILLGIGIEDCTQDDRLLYCIETVSDAVLAYCNISSIPPSLERTVVRMAAGFYASCGFGHQSEEAGGDFVGQNVSSVKRGDVTISYGSNGAAAAAESAAGGGGGVMDLLNDYKTVLQRFRRFSWETEA